MPLHLAMFHSKAADMIYLSIFKGSYSVQLRLNLYHFFPEREEGSCEGLKGRCCPASTHLYTAMCFTKGSCCGDTALQHPQRSWLISALTDTSRVKVSPAVSQDTPGALLNRETEGPSPTQWSVRRKLLHLIGKSQWYPSGLVQDQDPLSVGLTSRL